MRRGMFLTAAVLALCLGGCAAQPEAAAPSPTPTAATHIIQADEQALADINATTAPPGETPAPSPMPASVTAPDKDQVLAARERALEGMSQEDIDRLYTVITGANDWWEQQYLWQDIFTYLDDPQDPAWNYFDKTGKINVQWSITGDEYDAAEMADIMEKEGLSWTGFCMKYGTEDTLSQLIVDNEYDADGFMELVKEIQGTVQNEELKNDLQTVIDKTGAARATHDMGIANDLYKTLHDLDYFLLRYGPEDLGSEMRDAGLVSEYFGMLSFYR